MEIKTHQFISGAKKAEGLTVIIDVFRAYTTAAYIFAAGAEEIYVVAEIEKAESLSRELNNPVLIGERKGIKIKGFDYNNSPYFISQHDFSGNQVVLSTSAGTKGIINAEKADQILTGSFVNISATADYIREKNPDLVSLVAMGNNGVTKAEEDILYAEMLKNKLKGLQILSEKDIRDRLFNSAGQRFFEESTQSQMPKEDFYYSLSIDKFDFVIKAQKADQGIFRLKKI